MAPEELFSQLSESLNGLNLYFQYGSRSTKLLYTDPIRNRIHNTALNTNYTWISNLSPLESASSTTNRLFTIPF